MRLLHQEQRNIIVITHARILRKQTWLQSFLSSFSITHVCFTFPQKLLFVQPSMRALRFILRGVFISIGRFPCHRKLKFVCFSLVKLSLVIEPQPRPKMSRENNCFSVTKRDLFPKKKGSQFCVCRHNGP